MKISRRIALIAGLMLAMTSATAQYTASFQIVVTGNCFSGASSTAMNNIRQIINQYNAQFKAVPLTKEECMTMSQMLAGEIVAYEFSEYGCSIKIIVTPCICTRCQDEATPGPDQGGSYYSTNPGNEVRDWEADVERRNQALNNGATPPPSQVEEYFGKGSVDIRFNNALQSNEGMSQLPGNAVNLPSDFELLANMENVKRYMEGSNDLLKLYLEYPFDITVLIHDEFEKVSNIDIDAIRNKLPSQRTEEEKQVMLDYQAYCKKMSEKMYREINALAYEAATREETRAYEMSVLSETCYGDSKHENITKTNYIEVGQSFFDNDKDNPMRGLLELIGECNQTKKETGFHAELYFNKITGEYTIAFEGTNATEMADIKADAMIGLNEVSKQHDLAMRIAEYINNLDLPDNVKINVTGHSLGGSLASVVGLATGLPTYTYNSAGVNNAMAEKYGFGDMSASSNIKAYQSNTDPLTSVQEGSLKPIVVGTVITVVSSVNPAKGVALASETAKGNTASPAVGDKNVVQNYGGHTIHNMISHFEQQCNSDSFRYNNVQESIRQAQKSIEQQTEDHILIIWQNEE